MCTKVSKLLLDQNIGQHWPKNVKNNPKLCNFCSVQALTSYHIGHHPLHVHQMVLKEDFGT